MKLLITESDIRKMVSKCIAKLCEDSNGGDLESLLAYLSQQPDTEIESGGHVNIKAKAYNYFEPKGIVHDAWALHFTYAEVFDEIIENGFVHGCTDLDRLAYTDSKFDSEGNASTEANNGWCFALPINNGYLGEDCGYGDCGFLIKTDGVLAYHKIDHDNEIIFKNDYVKESIPFAYEEDYGGWNVCGISENIDPNNLPNGAFYEEDIEAVLFEDIRSMIEFLIKQ